ncbi:hypothetical protein VTN77DRAFT_2620 [Rasamsonia byssochlamydoides]|uniref:uncharacterized protein n=1 Tax=Rasamsonia byssochlamydoides TaxID=89139 RepID=UPI00374254C0
MAPKGSLLTLCLAAFATSTYAARVPFELHLTWEEGAPDGNARKMIFMNGQFPGPQLTVDEGDEVEFLVHNHLPFNTSIHFHGIEQMNTPWSDGVPGLTQRPIPPGESFLYRWTATTYGTYWYHSHYDNTMADGLYGPIWIRPKRHTPTPFHLISNDPEDLEAMHRTERDPRLVVLSDWEHLTSEEYFNLQKISGLDIFCVDSILINGKGAVHCPSADELYSYETPYLKGAIDNLNLTDKGCYPNIYKTQGNYSYDESKVPWGVIKGCVPTEGNMEVIEVDASERWASFKFIGAAFMKSLVVSIDEHPMWIYEVDGRYIEPRLVHDFPLFNGERYGAMIKLDKTPKNYTIRVADTNGDQIISGYAILSYKGGQDLGPSKPYINYGGLNVSADVVQLNTTYLPPYPNIKPSRTADQMFNLTMGRIQSSWQWTLQGSQLYDVDANADTPILFDLDARKNLGDKLTLPTKNGTWVDLLLQLGQFPNTTKIQAPHVIHKHSNKAFWIGAGPGFFNWTSVDEAIESNSEYFNLENPIYRDTFVTNGAFGPTWMVLRYQVVNPGPFLIHCHIETHLTAGMGVALLDGVDAWPEVPPEYNIHHVDHMY